MRNGLKEPLLPDETPKMKYVSIDIETTGLDPDFCQVLEIGAVIDDWKLPINELPSFRRVIQNKTLSGEPFALALNVGLLRLLADPQPSTNTIFCQPDELGRQFAPWLTENGIDPKHVQAAGKNFASFDAIFLDRLPDFKSHVEFRHRVLDPAILFWQPAKDEKLPDSATCYKRAGLDSKVAHTAVDDAKGVVWLIRSGLRNLKVKSAP